MQRLNTATPVSTFPLRRWLPDWTSYIRANFSSNWQEGAWLCYCLWGESWGQVHRLGESQRDGEREREKVCSSSSPTRESITQPCLCFPNSFWFSRKLWAKLERTNIHQSSASSQTCTHQCSLCVCALSQTKSVFVCVCVPFWQQPEQKYKCLWKELSLNSSFGINTRAVFSSFSWNSSLRQL